MVFPGRGGQRLSRLSRTRGLARQRTLKDVSTLSSRTVHCSVTVAGGSGVAVESVTVQQSTVGYMP